MKKYTIFYEFEDTVEFRNFNTKEEAQDFIKDDEQVLCQDGDFVKYYLVSGEFEMNGGFIDRVEKK